MKTILLLLFLLSSPAKAINLQASILCDVVNATGVDWFDCSASGNLIPSWTSTPNVTGITGVAGSFTFSSYINGVPAPECQPSMTNGTLPTGVSWFGPTCTLSWTNQVTDGATTGLRVTATNSEGTALSDFFSITFSTQDADLLWVNNFDSADDWNNGGNSTKCRFTGDGSPGNPGGEGCYANAAATPPFAGGFEYIYITDKNSTTPNCNVDSVDPYLGTGKSIRFYDESNGDDNSWGSDCTLMKYFGPTEYPTMAASYLVKFNENMTWEGGSEGAKIFRMGHIRSNVADGTLGTSVFNFTNSKNVPGNTTVGFEFVDAWQYSSTNNDYRLKLLHRCNSKYKCENSPQNKFEYVQIKDGNGNVISSWADTYGSGTWHKITLVMTMNSSPGTADGVYEVWWDGVLQKRRTNMEYMDEGNSISVTGFNTIMVGGNSSNTWAGQTDAEQLLQNADNICVATGANAAAAKAVLDAEPGCNL